MSTFPKKTTSVFISLVLMLQIYANNGSTKDSLLNIVSGNAADSVKIEALRTLAERDNYADREESIQYYQQILMYPVDASLKGETLNRIGFFYWQLGNFEKAISSYNKALEEFILVNDSAFMGRTYNNIAVSYWGLGKNIEALRNYQFSLEIRQAIKDIKGVSTVLNNIGKIYQQLQLYDKAFETHKQALKYAFKVGESNPIAYSYSNIGDCFKYTGKLDSALNFYSIGYDILLKEDPQNRSNSYYSSRIGEVYSLMDQPDSAHVYNKKALAYAIRINNKNRIAIAEHNLGKTYFKINQSDSAKFYINSSFRKAEENGYDVLVKDNLFIMAKLAEADNNIDEAYHYFKRAAILNDSIYNVDVISKVADTQVKYLTEQKERENLVLRENNEVQKSTIKQQRTFTVLLLILSGMILVVLYFMAQSRKAIKKLNLKLEESEKHLKKANANKDRFFTIIAHDLRSPFNGILGITELLDNQFDTLSHDHKKELVGMLHESSSSVFGLINSLLQWAQVQQNEVKYNLRQLDLHKISSKVCKTQGASALNKDIQIINNIPKEAKVFADKNSTKTVLRNLINNAIKFTETGGRIEISAQISATKMTICVKDNGIGIKSEIQEKLFLIHEKITRKGTHQETGSGLGLLLCKELVEKNKGNIWVESEFGSGSSFFFSLPMA